MFASTFSSRLRSRRRLMSHGQRTLAARQPRLKSPLLVLAGAFEEMSQVLRTSSEGCRPHRFRFTCVFSCGLCQERRTQGAGWDIAACVQALCAGRRRRVEGKPRVRPTRRRCQRTIFQLSANVGDSRQRPESFSSSDTGKTEQLHP